MPSTSTRFVCHKCCYESIKWLGKCPLLSQVASQVASKHGRTLYVTGEECVQQVKMRAERLGALRPELLLAAETEIEVVEAHIGSLKPKFVVIDSIQTMHDSSIA